MLLLVLFGFIAGAATAVSPCILPVLPVALAAGSTGGRRRPIGIVAGLTVSFTFAIVALVYLLDALGLPDQTAAQPCHRCAARLRPDAAGAGPVESGRRTDQPGDQPVPAEERRGRGLLVRNPDRRQPRPGLRPLCRSDPGRGHHRLRLAAVHGRTTGRGAGLRARLGSRSLPADDRRTQADQAARPPDAASSGCDGRGDGRFRPGHGRGVRPPVPERDRRQPSRGRGQPDQVAGVDSSAREALAEVRRHRQQPRRPGGSPKASERPKSATSCRTPACR